MSTLHMLRLGCLLIVTVAILGTLQPHLRAQPLWLLLVASLLVACQVLAWKGLRWTLGDSQADQRGDGSKGE